MTPRHASGVAIKAVAFDAGGTLIEPWPSVGHVYARVAAQRRGIRLDPEAVNRRFRLAWTQRADFDYSRSAWKRLVESTLEGCWDRRLDAGTFDAMYDRFAEPDCWRVFDEVPDVLRALNAAGFQLAVISNWDERLRPLLDRLGLAHWFATLTISSETRAVKPEPGMFHRTAAALGVAPGEMLHVGDSELEDYAGATAAGCVGVWLRRNVGAEAAEAARWPVIGRLDGLFRALDM